MYCSLGWVSCAHLESPYSPAAISAGSRHPILPNAMLSHTRFSPNFNRLTSGMTAAPPFPPPELNPHTKYANRYAGVG